MYFAELPVMLNYALLDGVRRFGARARGPGLT